MNWEGAKKGIAFKQRMGKVFIARFKDWSKKGVSTNQDSIKHYLEPLTPFSNISQE